MQIINPEIFYKYLITNDDFSNDFSLAAKNTYLDDYGKLHEHFKFDISNQSGEWLENQINIMETENDDDETTFGNFKYLTTIVSDDALFPTYSELFSLQLICFEKDRERVIKLFDDFATGVNNRQDELSLEDDEGKLVNYDLFIQLGELSTPDYGIKQDIGGAERFIIDLSFSIMISTGMIMSKKIKLYHFYDGNDITIPYNFLDIKRDNELLNDTRANVEKKYEINKSDMTISLGAIYTNNAFSQYVMDYLIDPTYGDREVIIHYVDEASGIKEYIETTPIYNREKTYICCIAGAEAKYEYGQAVSYTVSLKIKINN